MQVRKTSDVKTRLIRATARTRLWVRRHVPRGFRLPTGLLLIAAGMLGMLPILGFWMIPLGIAVAALDVGPLWRALKRRRERKAVEPNDR